MVLPNLSHFTLQEPLRLRIFKLPIYTLLCVTSVLDKVAITLALHQPLITNLPEWYSMYQTYHQTDLRIYIIGIEVFCVLWSSGVVIVWS